MKPNDLYQISQSFRPSARMPVLFLGHGSPMNAIEENEFVKGLRQIGQTLPPPQAILCVSAHWETRGTFVTAMEFPRTIHDFGGFPEALYQVQYPAPGSPGLAREVCNQIRCMEVIPDHDWGLDHGAWSVLKHLYPQADVPVVQMSLDYLQTPQYHYEWMQELRSLRDRGVLIVGSGNMVHNLRLLDWTKLDSDNYAFDWAREASEKMKQFIRNDEHKKLINYRCHGKAFELAIPTPEHYLPLLSVLALKDRDEMLQLFNDKAVAGSLTMTSVKIG